MTKIQKKNLLRGLKAEPQIQDKSTRGKTKRIRIAANIATTPNNLFEIDHKIA